MNVDGEYLLHVDDHVMHDVFLETGRLGLDGVLAGKHVVKNIGTGCRGFGGDFAAGIVVGEHDGRILHHCA